MRCRCAIPGEVYPWLAGGGSSVCGPRAVPRVPRPPLGGICRLLRGLWGWHLARPVRRLRGALPGSAFGTLQWIKPSFIPAPGCPFCSLKPPQGHLCRPVPVHSAEHEQVLCLDRLLRPCVLMEALCPPGTSAERVLRPVPGKVQSLPLCRLLPHSVVTTVCFQDVC